MYDGLLIDQPGPFFGLTVVLKIEQSEYMKFGQTQQAGARVVIHSSKILVKEFHCFNILNFNVTFLIDGGIPLIDEKGIDIQPNTLTQLGVQEMVVTRIEAPWTSQCINSWSMTNYSGVASHHPNLPYSMAVILTLLYCPWKYADSKLCRSL